MPSSFVHGPDIDEPLVEYLGYETSFVHLYAILRNLDLPGDPSQTCQMIHGRVANTRRNLAELQAEMDGICRN